jgi:DNA-binding transcriptional regulator YiaG
MPDHTGIAQRQQEWPPDKIRALRHRMAMSQPEFAEVMDVSTKTIMFWETGRASPSWPRIRKLRQLARQITREEETS